MTIAFTFPGQGSQAVGMGKALAEAFGAAKDVFAEVDEALSQKLSKLMWEGPENDLILTENAQPALMAVSMAIVRVLEREGGFRLAEKCSYVAGHSLGEYSALAAAGAFSLSDAARVLKARGQAMQRAVPVGVGAMAALLGAEIAQAEALCKEASTDREIAAVANDNAPGQVVISGHKAAIDRAAELVKAHGIKRAMMLPVSAPFHSPLMAPAAEEMARALEQAVLNTPSLPVISNVTVKPVIAPDEIKKLLVEQVTGRVRWRETIESLPALGVTKVVEAGAGKVLTGMAKRITKDVEPLSLETPQEIEAFLKSV
ncbi:Malonyl CoA-acyl carrier protein transacylase [Alphaproteobacteria bacterium SO-S41]|nr:Malonyl CoA-acyl carrier protein transacylase [Alphaproteobacteria bacterium SO-S41]